MTYGQNDGQPDPYPQHDSSQWPQELWPPQYQQPWAGAQRPQGEPWHPQPYDSGAHQQLGAQQHLPQGQQQFTPPHDGPQQYGQPYQQPGYGQPPWEPLPTSPPLQQPRRRPWPARHKVLTGVIAVGSLIVISVVANAAVSGTGKPAADTAAVTSSPTAPSSPSAAAQPDCATQATNWADGGQITTFGNDVGSFSTAVQGLASDIETGADTSSDTAAVESSAATIQSDAQAVEADPGPSCIPGLRGNVTAGAKDYSAAAIDMTNALSELSAGNMTVATADVQSANAEMGNGTSKIAAATTAVKNFSASQGA